MDDSKIKVDRYYFIDLSEEDEPYFWAGVDAKGEELEYDSELKNAIPVATLHEAKEIKKVLKERWDANCEIVKIKFEFIK